MKRHLSMECYALGCTGMLITMSFGAKKMMGFLFRLKGPDFGMSEDEMDEDEMQLRVVLTAPHKDLPLEPEDIAFMLVQYVSELPMEENQ